MRVAPALPAETRRGMTGVAARYRVDFYGASQKTSAEGGARGTKPWLIESVYVDDAELVEVVTWAFDHAGDAARFVLFVEQEVQRDGDKLTVISRLMGTAPATETQT